MSNFDVSARMKVREGELDGFKKQAAECIRVTRDKDTKTLRYDWFLSEDETECEIREAYVDADGFFEHRAHVGEALNKLFAELADAQRECLWRCIPRARRVRQRQHAAGKVCSGIGSSRDSSLFRIRLADRSHGLGTGWRKP
jgi:quinol monooxygenase YgiN